MVIGLYYCTDIPAALKPQLQRYMDQEGEGEGEAGEVNLGILFSLYSLPNVRNTLNTYGLFLLSIMISCVDIHALLRWISS